MKPDWDKLIDDFSGSETQLVADVDCTEAGKELCEANGVQGYPTIKYGDPSDLQDYQGGRDYDSLKAFADENLKPMCGPAHIDLCEDDKKAEIEGFLAMPVEDLEAKIKEKEDIVAEAEAHLKDELVKLQEQYQKLSADKEKVVEEIKAGGLGLMKSVKATKAAAAKAEL